MARADSNNITNALVDSSRRGFLSQCASVAAGGALLGMTIPLPISAERVPDPIFAAIEAHKATCADIRSIHDTHALLERELPREKRQSHVDAWEESIIFDDDPRWIECERAVMRCWMAQDEAAVALIDIRPTTLAGVMELLRYAVEANVDGMGWPLELLADDDKTTRSWQHFLIESVAKALPQCA
jgi:hypothetical protein